MHVCVRWSVLSVCALFGTLCVASTQQAPPASSDQEVIFFGHDVLATMREVSDLVACVPACQTLPALTSCARQLVADMQAWRSKKLDTKKHLDQLIACYGILDGIPDRLPQKSALHAYLDARRELENVSTYVDAARATVGGGLENRYPRFAVRARDELDNRQTGVAVQVRNLRVELDAAMREPLEPNRKKRCDGVLAAVRQLQQQNRAALSLRSLASHNPAARVEVCQHFAAELFFDVLTLGTERADIVVVAENARGTLAYEMPYFVQLLSSQLPQATILVLSTGTQPCSMHERAKSTFPFVQHFEQVPALVECYQDKQKRVFLYSLPFQMPAAARSGGAIVRDEAFMGELARLLQNAAKTKIVFVGTCRDTLFADVPLLLDVYQEGMQLYACSGGVHVAFNPVLLDEKAPQLLYQIAPGVNKLLPAAFFDVATCVYQGFVSKDGRLDVLGLSGTPLTQEEALKPAPALRAVQMNPMQAQAVTAYDARTKKGERVAAYHEIRARLGDLKGSYDQAMKDLQELQEQYKKIEEFIKTLHPESSTNDSIVYADMVLHAPAYDTFVEEFQAVRKNVSDLRVNVRDTRTTRDRLQGDMNSAQRGLRGLEDDMVAMERGIQEAKYWLELTRDEPLALRSMRMQTDAQWDEKGGFLELAQARWVEAHQLLQEANKRPSQEAEAKSKLFEFVSQMLARGKNIAIKTRLSAVDFILAEPTLNELSGTDPRDPRWCQLLETLRGKLKTAYNNLLRAARSKR